MFADLTEAVMCRHLSSVILGCITGEIYRKTSRLHYLLVLLEFTDSLAFHTCIIYYSICYDMCLEYNDNIQQE